MNNLEIKHLRMVAAIAQTGNMTKAAARLFLSQSALSQQLKDIEGKLGADLFHRTRKKMILTPVGRKLADMAERVIEAVEGTEREIAGTVAGHRGEMKVGIQCIFCYKWLPEVLRLFQEKFPNIELEIGTSINLAEELEGKRFDFIVTAAPTIDERFVSAPLFADQMVCVMPTDHPLADQAHVGYSDFNRYNFIAHAEKGRNRFYQAVLKPRGVEPKRFMAVGQPQAILEMVASGFGISIFPAWAVKEALATTAVTARPITSKGVSIGWRAVFLPGGQVPLFQQELIGIIGRMKIDSQPMVAV